MDKKNKEKSSYFQSIAQYFFSLRGAPFFLSSRDLDCITRWENMEVPLHVAKEGIKRSFENFRSKSVMKSKILSLSICNLQVLKAFEQYREREVGRKRRAVGHERKKKRVKDEIKKFLTKVPPSVGYLTEVYTRAQKMLTRRYLNEEELERIEEEIEELLLKNSSEEEKNIIKKDILAEYEFKEEEEFMRIFRIKLVKTLRDKYKIPYISLFYY